MLSDVLKTHGDDAVDKIKKSLSTYSATGKTAASIRFESTDKTLKIFGREFIEAIETGRGARKSSQPGGFEDSMLEYMKAKGIGSNLTEKKRKQLARFLVLRINRDGDKLHKSGSRREVYSKLLEQITEELIEAVAKDQLETASEKVFQSLKDIK
jgi:hypothetical protein